MSEFAESLWQLNHRLVMGAPLSVADKAVPLAALARLEELEEIVARLPKTKDGVLWLDLKGAPLISEPTAYYLRNSVVYEVRKWRYNWERVLLGSAYTPFSGVNGEPVPIDVCYSTREAAEAASKGGAV